jgi:hypothetical protein
MVIRTYLTKNNSIVNNRSYNTGKNPITELFYGGTDATNTFSRFIFNFDVERLKTLYTGNTFTDLTKLTHTLKLTNTGAFDTGLLNGNFQEKNRASSFDLILFKIQQDWDEGVGYDYGTSTPILGENPTSVIPSNWEQAQTGVFWSGGTGVYSGSPSGITITTQHFDLGNENINMDITDYINGVITGNTHHGLGIAFPRGTELTQTSSPNYVGFFTRHTQTFYEPYIETIYSNHITDDRDDFYLDKTNKLYLYVNLLGTPTNLDSLPTVSIYNNDNTLLISANTVTHITKGVYATELTIYSSASTINDIYTDRWSNIVINGIQRPSIDLSFSLKDSLGYYNIGDNNMLPKEVSIIVSGIKSNERIKRGDTRKVILLTKIPYTVNQTQKIDSIEYRLFVKEGNNEITIIDYQPVELANNHYYFLLDTQSLIPNTYYIEFKVETNLVVKTLNNVFQFEITSQSLSRNSQ